MKNEKLRMERGPVGSPQPQHEAISTFYIFHSSFRLHAVSWPGPADATPLIMLHGIWDTWRTFERVGGRLAGGRAVHALDLRGHGESDKPAEGYGHADYAGDVLGVLDQLGLDRVDLLGFSLGALVAARLAADAPGRVARLILEDPPHSPEADPRGRAAWLRILLDLKRRPFEEIVEELGDLYPTRDRATNEASARALMNTADGPFRALLDGPAADPGLPALLAGYDRPTLILRADPDYGGALSAGGRAALLAARPDARLIDFPATGHLIHAEREDAFIAAVEDFLAGERV
jgi:pimeloyl-ACP methyl ester carboxylesterase